MKPATPPPYPLLFQSIFKSKVWGGRELEKFGKQLPPGENIGESWELADLPPAIPGGRSVIANGEFNGITLHQAIAQCPDQIMGDAKLSPEGGFPLLIKFLDARQNLSVQVHPNEDYARRHPDSHLKSEAWVILQAEPGSVIYKGVQPDITAAEFAAHIKNGTVVNDLIAVPARVGDCHYLPSGTCHALGGGIVVAEIQTPSDTTFRVFDWNRPDGAAGGGRELHIEQALECIKFGPSAVVPQNSPNSAKLHKPIEVRGIRTTPFAATEHFEIDRVDAMTMARFSVETSGLPEVWLLLAGSARLESAKGQTVDLQTGTTVLIPAALEGWHCALARSAWMLRVRLPSPLKGLIA
jgi:mannose-6-phosphate isomerase